jgi:NADPH:quinone reductase-like Zn-dependent oxidoreductase
MRAAVVTRFGGPEVFELTELPDPVPGPGQVAIDVTYAAVGLVDIYIRQGLYKDRAGLPQPPYVPGLEVAGTIRALGDGVEGFHVAEPVVTLSGTGAEGGYASSPSQPPWRRAGTPCPLGGSSRYVGPLCRPSRRATDCRLRLRRGRANG